MVRFTSGHQHQRRTAMHAEIPLALTYDDVLLLPRRSSIPSRRAVDPTTRLTRRIPLAIPLVSANVDTVAEAAMASAMVRMGGIGIIHRRRAGR